VKRFFFALVVCLVIGVCSLAAKGPDVYVVGSEENAQGRNIAVLWKNGVAQSFSDGKSDAWASSVFVKK